jgi:hypothetical protein
MQVKDSMNLEKSVQENELIVRKHRVIEMKSFGQYHIDHLQKDLEKRRKRK